MSLARPLSLPSSLDLSSERLETRLLQFSLDALASLAHGNTANTRALVEAGCVGLVLRLLEAHLGDFGMLRSGCIVLAILRESARGAEEIAGTGEKKKAAVAADGAGGQPRRRWVRCTARSSATTRSGAPWSAIGGRCRRRRSCQYTVQ